MIKSHIKPFDPLFQLKNFEICNLQMESECLKRNPLNDSWVRHQILLVPKLASGAKKNKWPVVFHLSGYFSTGYQKFQVRTLEPNLPQKIDSMTSEGVMKPALHVFVEASNFWGGSQFIDSPGSGLYGRFVKEELAGEIQSHFGPRLGRWVVSGGSSGGYGSLQLISQKDSPFSKAVVVAPDSFFEMSLLPEVYKVARHLKKISSLRKLKMQLSRGESIFKSAFFAVANVLAMAHCYSGKEDISSRAINWPIDLESGVLKPKIWEKWKQKDPLVFLPQRRKALKDQRIYLSVGAYDEYHLQYGARQIRKILKTHKISHSYSEFQRGHRDLSSECLTLLCKAL